MGNVIETKNKQIRAEVHSGLSDIDENQLEQVVRSSIGGSVFHHYDWLKTVQHGFDVEPRHVTLNDVENDTLIGIFPNFLSSIKYTTFTELGDPPVGFSGPILTTLREEYLNLLFDEIDRAHDGNATHHSITVPNPGYVRYASYLDDRRYRQVLRDCRFALDVTDEWVDIYDSMTRQRQSDLDRAREQEFRIENPTLNESTVREFYYDYEEAMREIGAATLPYAFFRSMAEFMPDKVELFRAYVDDRRVGSHLLLLDEYQSSVMYYFTSIHPDDYEYKPAILLHEHGIKWAKDNGFETYDLGSTSAHFDDGLFQYKQQYGATIVPALSWERPLSQAKYAFFRIGRRLYRNRDAVFDRDYVRRGKDVLDRFS